MNSLLITQLDRFKYRARSQNKRPRISIDNHSQKDGRNNSVFYNNQLPAIIEKSKEDFMEFMIDVETKYANLDQIEMYFKNSVDKLNQKFNLNEDTINTKQKFIKEMNLKIENEIALQKKIDSSQVKSVYEGLIAQITNQIEEQEHEINVLMNSKNNLYNSNVVLKKKLQLEHDLIAVDQNQFNHYRAINNNAIKEYKNEKQLLSRMKDFNEISSLKRDFELNNKKKAYIRLDSQVLSMKEEATEMEKLLESMKKEIDKQKNILKEVNNKNLEINRDNNAIRKENIGQIVHLAKINEALNVESIEEIIIQFKEGRMSFRSLVNTFFLLNNEKISLNNEISALTRKLEETKTALMQKITKESHYELIVNNQRKNRDLCETDPLLQKLVIDIKEIQEGLDCQDTILKRKTQICSNSIKKLLNIDLKTESIMNEFFNKTRAKNKYNEDKDGVKALIPNLLCDLPWDTSKLKLFIEVFNKFLKKSLFLYNTLLVYAQRATDQESKNEEEVESENENRFQPDYIDLCDNRSMKNCNDLFQNLKKLVAKQIEHNEIIARLDIRNRDISKKKKKEDIKKEKEVETSSIKTIFYDFWLKQREKEDIKGLSKISQGVIGTKLISIVKRYMSDIVENDLKKPQGKERKKAPEETFDTALIEEILRKKNLIKEEEVEKNKIDNSYESSDEAKVETISKKPEIRYRKEKNQIEEEFAEHIHLQNKRSQDLYYLNFKAKIGSQKNEHSYNHYLYKFLKASRGYNQETKKEGDKLITFREPKIKLYKKKENEKENNTKSPEANNRRGSYDKNSDRIILRDIFDKRFASNKEILNISSMDETAQKAMLKKKLDLKVNKNVPVNRSNSTLNLNNTACQNMSNKTYINELFNDDFMKENDFEIDRKLKEMKTIKFKSDLSDTNSFRSTKFSLVSRIQSNNTNNTSSKKQMLRRNISTADPNYFPQQNSSFFR